MNKLVHIVVVASVLVSGGIAFGQDRTQSTTDKHLLQDSQMDDVTAGSAVAVYGSSVTTSNSAAVSLSGSALSGASGVNIVNESNSLVANGVNVYDSSLTTPTSTSGAAVNQVNTTKQTEGVNANVYVPLFVTANLGCCSAEVLAFTADVTATNIAADGSSVDTASSNSVDLAGSAEQNAAALNIVNAAGGLVSNGVNIAHSSNMNAIPTLNQVNVTSQSR
jgi:hypothetical protein